MIISDLNENELIALVGLAKYVIFSDNLLTQEENLKLQALTEKIGLDEFRLLLDKFEKCCPDIDSFRDFLKTIQNQEPREYIYRVIFDLATVDSVDNIETSLLSWLEKEWDLNIGIYTSDEESSNSNNND
jgi:hypothetical protein